LKLLGSEPGSSHSIFDDEKEVVGGNMMANDLDINFKFDGQTETFQLTPRELTKHFFCQLLKRAMMRSLHVMRKVPAHKEEEEGREKCLIESSAVRNGIKMHDTLRAVLGEVFDCVEEQRLHCLPIWDKKFTFTEG